MFFVGIVWLVWMMTFCYGITIRDHVKINLDIPVLRWYGIELKLLAFLPVLVFYCW
uniref:Uncharacterized protein n=1 Tax=Glossina palpalis gambiensis TaxID=67801 RepID=A0A1B0AKW3_9MUSC